MSQRQLRAGFEPRRAVGINANCREPNVVISDGFVGEPIPIQQLKTGAILPNGKPESVARRVFRRLD